MAERRVLFVSRGEENLGVEYLSAFLKHKGVATALFFDPGFDDIFFLQRGKRAMERLKAKLLQAAASFAPDLVAFSSVTLTYGPILQMARWLKQAGYPTVLGGVHATTLQEQVLHDGGFDYICIGEGEHAIYELLQAIAAGETPTCGNIWYKQDGRVRKNPLNPLIQDLDSLPFPDKDIYYRQNVFSTRLTIMTSRGCPFACTYCINDLYHRLYPGQKPVRRRSVDNVIAELAMWKQRYPLKKVRFYDDVFTVNKGWVEAFAERYARDIAIPYHCNIEPRAISPDMLKALKHSGCVAVSMGVQSGSQRIRDQIMGRRMSNEEIVNAAEMVHRSGLKLLTEIIFAIPSETEEEMWQTVALNRTLRPHNTAAFNFFPFPGVALTETSRHMGLLDEEVFQNVVQGKKGFNTWNRMSVLNHPLKEKANAIKQLVPLFARLPRLSFLFRPLTGRYLRWLGNLLFFAGYPLFDTQEFFIKLKDYLRYLFHKKSFFS